MSFEHEVECGVSVSAMMETLKDQNTLFPKLMPQAISSIEVLEGEGGPGTVRVIKAGPIAKDVEPIKEKIISVDPESCSVTSEVVEGGYKTQYGFTKWVQTTKIVAVGSDSCKVHYTAQYEGGSDVDKAIAEVKGLMTNTFKVVEAHIKGSA